MSGPARIDTAELLAVGAELLVGETRDTNSGDLAAELTKLGVEVRRSSALPDRLEDVADALADALRRARLVITTGGLGPTPDDLTREAIARVCGAVPFVDPEQERWLRGLFERRGLPFSTANLKQAWLIEGGQALANARGTAPGWWVERPDGRVIVALPGPPREMRPMWQAEVLPRLAARGLGIDRAAETLRLTAIGESMLVDLIGEEVLRVRNPEIATYARLDAVDVRVSAVGTAERSAREQVDEAIASLLPRIGQYVFARGEEGWPEAIGRRLAGRRLAIVEIGTSGYLGVQLGGAPWLALGEQIPDRSPLDRAARDLRAHAQRVRDTASADVGLAVRARERRGDMTVTIAIADGRRTTYVHRLAFLGGEMGRRRAANLACAELWGRLSGAGASSPTRPPTAGR